MQSPVAPPAPSSYIRLLRPEDYYHLIYMALTALIVIFAWKSFKNPAMHLLIRAGISAFILIYVPFAQRKPSPVRVFLRDYYYMLAFIFYYPETAALHSAFWGGQSFDDFIAWFDHLIFQCQPSLEFYKTFSSALFSEIMNFCYTFYYLLFSLGGLVIWLRRDRGAAYGRAHHAINITMLVCYIIFIAFPVLGPQFRWAELHSRQNFQGYFFKYVLDSILEFGEAPTGAFPSSHVALAFVIMAAFWNYARRAFWFSAPIVLGLFISTVYIQAHYVVDVPAGILTGWLGWRFSEPIRLYAARKYALRHESLRLEPGEISPQ